MSAWWIIGLVLIGGGFGAAAILLYHSRMPELDTSAGQRNSRGSSHRVRQLVASKGFARGLHAALAVGGLGGFLLALGQSTRGLGEAVIGLTAMLGLLVSLRLKYLGKREESH
jgi:hypothetical protein